MSICAAERPNNDLIAKQDKSEYKAVVIQLSSSYRAEHAFG